MSTSSPEQKRSQATFVQQSENEHSIMFRYPTPQHPHSELCVCSWALGGRKAPQVGQMEPSVAAGGAAAAQAQVFYLLSSEDGL